MLKVDIEKPVCKHKDTFETVKKLVQSYDNEQKEHCDFKLLENILDTYCSVTCEQVATAVAVNEHLQQ